MSASASLTAPKNSGPEVRQFQFGTGAHDSTQYNFFAGDKVFSVRVMTSRDIDHYSAWLYDGGVREVVLSDAPMERKGSDHLDLEAERFSIRSDDEKGGMRATDRDSEPVFDISFRTPITFDWATPAGGAVIHQPLIRAEIAYRGETLSGIGYCKRAWFDHETDYLAWRFIEGELGGGRSMLWTADGNFGGDYNKYDYFKIVHPDGRLLQSADTDSRHRDNAAYATIDGEPCEATIEGLGTWSALLRGEETRLKLRQRFCRLTLRHGDRVEEGYAINETGTGAIR